jgi:hypothetical protein
LRELRFMKELEEWEIEGLIDIIVKSDNVNQLEDDLVTMLWEKDFVHIGYLATDEFLEETPVVIPENVAQFRKNLVFKPLVPHVEMDMMADEEAEEEFWIVRKGTESLFFADVATPGDPNNRVKASIRLDQIQQKLAAFLTNKAAWSKKLGGDWEFRHGGICLETTE